MHYTVPRDDAVEYNCKLVGVDRCDANCSKTVTVGNVLYHVESSVHIYLWIVWFSVFSENNIIVAVTLTATHHIRSGKYSHQDERKTRGLCPVQRQLLSIICRLVYRDDPNIEH